jgi:hypothetical protein
MSENIEGAAARRVASGSGKSSGAIAGIAGYLLGRGRGKGKGKGGGSSKSAEDFHNEEIAKRYDFERNLQQTRVDESVRNADFTRSESAANNRLRREGARVQSYLQHANDNKGTGRRIASVGSTGGDAFNITFGDAQPPAPRSAKPASAPKAPSRQFAPKPPAGSKGAGHMEFPAS